MPSHRIPENLRHLCENEDKQNLQGHNQRFILIIGFTLGTRGGTLGLPGVQEEVL